MQVQVPQTVAQVARVAQLALVPLVPQLPQQVPQVPLVPQAEMQPVAQEAPVPQRAGHHEPQHRLPKQPHLRRSQPRAQLVPRSIRSHAYSIGRIAPSCTIVHH